MKKKKISHVNCHLSHVTCHLSHVTCHLSLVTCHMYTLKCTPGITRSSESIDMLRYESQFYAVRLSEARLVEEKSIVGGYPRVVDSSKYAAPIVADSILDLDPVCLQSSPRAKIEFSRDRPRAQIHLATPSAGPQIVPV